MLVRRLLLAGTSPSLTPTIFTASWLLKKRIWSSLSPARGKLVSSKLARTAELGTGLDICSDNVEAHGEVYGLAEPSRPSRDCRDSEVMVDNRDCCG
jgi:hypothetical protein